MTPSTTSFGWAAAEPASTQPLTSATRTDGRVLARNGVMIWPSGAAHSITGARGERLTRPERGVERLIRSILETRWDARAWPTAKATLKQALEERKKIRRQV